MGNFKNGPGICAKDTARGTKLECPLESTSVIGNDAERSFHTNEDSFAAGEPKILKVILELNKYSITI